MRAGSDRETVILAPEFVTPYSDGNISARRRIIDRGELPRHRESGASKLWRRSEPAGSHLRAAPPFQDHHYLWRWSRRCIPGRPRLDSCRVRPWACAKPLIRQARKSWPGIRIASCACRNTASRAIPWHPAGSLSAHQPVSADGCQQECDGVHGPVLSMRGKGVRIGLGPGRRCSGTRHCRRIPAGQDIHRRAVPPGCRDSRSRAWERLAGSSDRLQLVPRPRRPPPPATRNRFRGNEQ